LTKKILDLYKQLAHRLPANPLDEIIRRVGGLSQVCEVKNFTNLAFSIIRSVIHGYGNQ
jgi:hypothetical protein